MNLFIDCISNPANLIIFNNSKNILKTKEINLAFNESSKLTPAIDNLLKEEKLEYKDLQNIVVVNGPGSFTGVRTIVLIANTINYVTQNNLTNINYFELFSKYPIIKKSSKRDVFFKKSKNTEIETISNDNMLGYIDNNKITKTYGDFDFSEYSNIINTSKVNYTKIIENISLKKEKQLDAFYIKKPTIS